MRGTSRAKYLFAACLCASTVDLIVVDAVVGPMALAEPGADAASGADAAAATATAPEIATAPPPGTGTGTGTTEMASPPAVVAPARVVARFDSDQQNASDDELVILAAEMKADPRRRIVLEGHTDQFGDRSHNRALSLDRAKWAQQRLVQLGVSESRIEVLGHGAERPLSERDDDAAIAENRRVEFRWLPSSPTAEEGDK